MGLRLAELTQQQREQVHIGYVKMFVGLVDDAAIWLALGYASSHTETVFGPTKMKSSDRIYSRELSSVPCRATWVSLGLLARSEYEPGTMQGGNPSHRTKCR